MAPHGRETSARAPPPRRRQGTPIPFLVMLCETSKTGTGLSTPGDPEIGAPRPRGDPRGHGACQASRATCIERRFEESILRAIRDGRAARGRGAGPFPRVFRHEQKPTRMQRREYQCIQTMRWGAKAGRLVSGPGRLSNSVCPRSPKKPPNPRLPPPIDEVSRARPTLTPRGSGPKPGRLADREGRRGPR